MLELRSQAAHLTAHIRILWHAAAERARQPLELWVGELVIIIIIWAYSHREAIVHELVLAARAVHHNVYIHVHHHNVYIHARMRRAKAADGPS